MASISRLSRERLEELVRYRKSEMIYTPGAQVDKLEWLETSTASARPYVDYLYCLAQAAREMATARKG